MNIRLKLLCACVTNVSKICLKCVSLLKCIIILIPLTRMYETLDVDNGLFHAAQSLLSGGEANSRYISAVVQLANRVE